MPMSVAGTGRPQAELVLTDEERETLLRWSRRATSAQALALRCWIVLVCAKGASNQQVAQELGVHAVTVGKWRARFVGARLEGLAASPLPRTAWYVKPWPTFADALAFVRRRLWASLLVPTSLSTSDPEKIPGALFAHLCDLLCYAA